MRAARKKTNRFVGMGGVMPASAQVLHFEPSHWEQFIEAAVRLRPLGQGKTYALVKRLGAANDKGRDVEARLVPDREPGKWDLYQAKHYENPLTPSNIFPELAKFFKHLAAGTYVRPRQYLICAPRSVGSDLFDLLATPDDFKQRLLADWKAGETGLQKLKADLTLAVEAVVSNFDFRDIRECELRDILDWHALDRSAHHKLFGIVAERMEVPADFATTGIGYATPKRTSSFNLFLTGNDDAAIQVTKTKAEVERIKGQLTSAEAALERVKAGLPSDVKREDVTKAIERVDATLGAMTSQYEARATKLKELRREIADTAEEQALAANRRNHAHSMIGRFELLDEKYANDLSRLGASNEGAAFFEALPEVACPLCGTGTADQHGHHDHPQPKPKDYQLAIKAEAEKIQSLRRGLLVALERERGRYSEFRAEAERLGGTLNALQNREAVVVNGARIEFTGDPKTLALRRSDLAAQLGIFDEIERLEAEVTRLGKSKVRKRVNVTRDGGTHGRAVADRAKAFLEDWGLTDIKNISLDAGECDLVINDRPRLSYGAGLRSLYLASLVIALMDYAVEHEHPHLGVVVLDSPLKPYADPKRTASPDVAPSTVREKFYRWLSDWAGHGQIVVLENEEVPDSLTDALKPIVFTKNPDVGRAGFYPYREWPEPADDAQPEMKLNAPQEASSDERDDDGLLSQP